MRKTFASVAILLALNILIGCPLKNTVSAAYQDGEVGLLDIRDVVGDGLVEDYIDDSYEEEATEEPPQDLVYYESPQYDPTKFHFVDHFDDIQKSQKQWIKSQAKKNDIAEEIAKYDGIWNWEAPQRFVWKNDIGLVLKSKAKHAAIASGLTKPFNFKANKPLIVQYEVTLQEGQDCGGSYIKLLSAGKATDDLTKFNDKTPYTIMFGPDKCGSDIKFHFIFRHVNPINGSISEKHCNKLKDRLEEHFKDKLPHLYTLIVRPNNSFEIRVDNKVVKEGSLLEDFDPSVNPPREIDDPEDEIPSDWDDRMQIRDPNAQKPDDWDDDAPPQIPDPTAEMPNDWKEHLPEMIPDPSAVKPDDWDSDMDGEWEPPLIDNPECEGARGCGKWQAPLIPNEEYKGIWRAPMIENPRYRGSWKPKQIPNPGYFEDHTPFIKLAPISAVGIELWSMSNNILFDNIIITDDEDVAKAFTIKSFEIKRNYIYKESVPIINQMIRYMRNNPWSWRSAIVIIVAYLAFMLYRLLSKGGKKDSAAEPKKTDAVQQDDEIIAAATKSSYKDKSDLDAKNYDEVLELMNEDDDSSESKESTEDGDCGEAEKETEETSTKPRKRRVRKDES